MAFAVGACGVFVLLLRVCVLCVVRVVRGVGSMSVREVVPLVFCGPSGLVLRLRLEEKVFK